MKVLYIINVSPLSDGGGGEKRAREVTRRLASNGNEVTILSGKTSRELDKWEKINGCQVRHATCTPNWLFAYERVSFYATRYLFPLFSLPVLCWLLKQREYDVVVENMAPYPTLSFVLTKLFGIPTVAVQHEFFDASSYDVYDPLTASIQLTVQNIHRLVEYAAIIVPTSHVKDRLVAYGVPESRLHVVPNGIDSGQYARTDVCREDTKLVTVGRLSKRKGQATLLRMLSELVETKPDAHLHLIGKGPSRSELEQLTVDLNLEDNVTFHGFLSEERKIAHLASSSIFVFASNQEGFGLVLLEAMAAGLPVVAKHLPVYEEFFGDGKNGFLLQSEDPVRFAGAVGQLLDRSDFVNEFSEQNIRTSNQFTWDRTVAETEEVLYSITADGNENESNDGVVEYA